MSAISSLKIGCYNVHNFCDGKFKNTIKEIAETLSNFDVVGLQEVTLKGLQTIKRNIGYNYVFADVNGEDAIGFVYNPKKVKILKHSKKIFEYKYPRALLSILLELDSGTKIATKIQLHITHLEHKYEYIRLHQIKCILNEISEISEISEINTTSQIPCLPCLPCLLMGDFNALKRADYSDDKWKSIGDTRKLNDWDPPKTDLIDYIESKNYKDIIGDFCSKKGLPVPLTSRFKTRVDYIFSFGNFDNFGTLTNCGFIDNDDSDHKLIFANFTDIVNIAK